MTPVSARERHAALALQIRKHDRAYYIDARPTISDPEYDRLYRELVDLEAALDRVANADEDRIPDLINEPRIMIGLSDGGAHVGTICDASFSTFLLTHWVARGHLSPAQAVQMLTQRNAAYLGLADRGCIAPGQRADLNLIDPPRLALPRPQLVRDLPAGGRRFLQGAQGYVTTWVAGEPVQREGQVTAARPGRLIRAGQAGAGGPRPA